MNDVAESALILESLWQRDALSMPAPVDLLRVFTTPDDVTRTLHCATYSSPMIAQEAAREAYGVNVWSSSGDGKYRSAGGEYLIQAVST